MPRVLLLAAHHLTVDVVSWHVMLGDVTKTWHAMNFGLAPKNAAGVHLVPPLVGHDVATRGLARRFGRSGNAGSIRSAHPTPRWAFGPRPHP
ncbi:hypothetical protein [Mycobacterium sp. URHB0021]